MDKQEFVNGLGDKNLSPLWEVYEKLVVSEPQRSEPSVIWKWADMLPQIEQSAELVHGKDADHRVLLMNNPHLDGPPATTSHMIAAYQCVLPGEQTSPHRHTPAATRIILEGTGGGTFVDGKRCDMYDGDLIFTPNWTWHNHHNDSDGRTIWVDVLDLPLVGRMDAIFGQMSKPDDEEYPGNNQALHHSWGRMSTALADAAPDSYGVRSIDYAEPGDGTPILATLDSRAAALAPGKGTRKRSMASELFIILEGAGESEVGNTTHQWGPKDVFTVPHWSWACHKASTDARFIVISDRNILKRLNLYREE